MLTVESLSKFSYRLDEASGATRATVRMPFRPAMARNSAFRLGENGHVQIEAGATTYRIDYETFDQRGLRVPRYRFFLMHGDTCIATATQADGRPRAWEIDGAGMPCRLVERSRLFSMQFTLDGASGRIGAIRETTRMLALRRRFQVDVPASLDTAVQAFLFFLAVNATFR